MSPSEAGQIIADTAPDLEIRTTKLLGSGSDSVAYLVNEEWVFRFPKDSAGRATLLKEAALLPELRKTLPVQVPRFEEVSTHADDLAYVRYRILPGSPLQKDIFEGLEAPKQEQALKDLAHFLRSLHDFPVPEARAKGVQEELYKGAFNPAQKRLLEIVDPHLETDEKTQIEEIIAAYENDKANKSTSVSLLHADIKPEHILCDPTDGHITGIIDWGDVCIGDVDYDFVCLYLFYDKDFVLRLLKYLPDQDIDRLFGKIQFFILIRCLQDIAIDAARGDNAAVQGSLERLRSHLREYAR